MNELLQRLNLESFQSMLAKCDKDPPQDQGAPPVPLQENSFRFHRPDLIVPHDVVAAQQPWADALVTAYKNKDQSKMNKTFEIILPSKCDPKAIDFFTFATTSVWNNLLVSGHCALKALYGVHPSFMNSKQDKFLTKTASADEEMKSNIAEFKKIAQDEVRCIVGVVSPFDPATRDHSERHFHINVKKKLCQITTRTSEPASRYTGLTLKEAILEMNERLNISSCDFVLGWGSDGKGIYVLDYGAISGVPLKTITREFVDTINNEDSQSGPVGHDVLGLMVQTGNFSALPIVTSIDLSNCKLGHLGNYCFNNCPLLVRIVLRSLAGLWVVGTHSFSDLPELTELRCVDTPSPSDILPCRIGEKSFLNNPKLTTVVMNGCDAHLRTEDLDRIYANARAAKPPHLNPTKRGVVDQRFGRVSEHFKPLLETTATYNGPLVEQYDVKVLAQTDPQAGEFFLHPLVHRLASAGDKNKYMSEILHLLLQYQIAKFPRNAIACRFMQTVLISPRPLVNDQNQPVLDEYRRATFSTLENPFPLETGRDFPFMKTLFRNQIARFFSNDSGKTLLPLDANPLIHHEHLTIARRAHPQGFDAVNKILHEAYKAVVEACNGGGIYDSWDRLIKGALSIAAAAPAPQQLQEDEQVVGQGDGGDDDDGNGNVQAAELEQVEEMEDEEEKEPSEADTLGSDDDGVFHSDSDDDSSDMSSFMETESEDSPSPENKKKNKKRDKKSKKNKKKKNNPSLEDCPPKNNAEKKQEKKNKKKNKKKNNNDDDDEDELLLFSQPNENNNNNGNILLDDEEFIFGCGSQFKSNTTLQQNSSHKPQEVSVFGYMSEFKPNNIKSSSIQDGAGSVALNVRSVGENASARHQGCTVDSAIDVDADANEAEDIEDLRLEVEQAEIQIANVSDELATLNKKFKNNDIILKLEPEDAKELKKNQNALADAELNLIVLELKLLRAEAAKMKRENNKVRVKQEPGVAAVSDNHDDARALAKLNRDLRTLEIKIEQKHRKLEKLELVREGGKRRDRE